MQSKDPFESEGNAAENFGMFEAAVHARPMAIVRHPIREILLALDGSNQDATARSCAHAIATGGSGKVRECRPQAGAPEILHALREQPADLLVLPAPFGRDYSDLREESLGSVVDLLLLSATCPVLCVRETLDDAAVKSALGDVLLPVNVPAFEPERAASWAFSLLRSGGKLEVLAIADRSLLLEAQALLGTSLDPESLTHDRLVRTVTDATGGLTAATQKAGTELGVHVHVECLEGRADQLLLSAANSRHRLLVITAPRQHTAPAFHRAVDAILGSRGPVLFV